MASEAREIAAALALANNAHTGQVDKAGLPYILHPQRVAESLDDPTDKVVALLHDVVEDSAYTITDIRRLFGNTVAEAVAALTRCDGESYGAFIARCGRNEIARRVKLADLADNMNLSRLIYPTEADYTRQRKYEKARAELERMNHD
jgi:(p)ppGpp synthase/HD superfamily hydrolase